MNTKANWTKVALLAGMSVAAVSLVGCSADGDKPDPNLRTPYQGKPIDDGISLYDENVNSVVGDDQERCGLMYNYVSLVDCKGKNPDFIAAVNRHSAKLKMDWDRILYWSGKCKTEDARAILVSARTDVDVSTERGRKEVRDKLRGVWGDDVDRMPVLQQQDSIVNTMEQDQMVPFHDETPQIRVTLVPLKDDCRPDPASIEGIMAD